MLIHAAGWLFAGFALCGAGYALVVSRLVDRFGKHASGSSISPSAVTLLKPLHFDEPGLEENLASFLAQDYPAPVQLVFGVQDAKDPAIKTVGRLKARFPDADIELVIDTELHGTNRKVSNLVNMARLIKHDIVVLSDSDIGVSQNWLSQVVGALEAPGVGAVTCLYAGKAAGNVWSVISAMGATYEFLPNVIAGVSWGLAQPCLGSTIALKREVLNKIGGLRAFADHLADDYEIGRAVRNLGLSIAVPPFVVNHASPETRWSTYYRHELRWNRTTRVINWMGHTGSIITHAVPLGVFGTILSGFTLESALILGVALSSRLWLKWRVERKFGTYAGPALVLPARDMIAFAVYLASFFGEDVHWRGTRFQVSPTGALVQS